MASALIDYARSHSIEPKSQEVDEFENFPGEGIHGKIDGKDVYVGNTKIALRAKCATVPSLEDYSKDGKSIGYIFLGATPAGFFTLSDACRTGIKEAITELKSMGIKTAMLTGDSHEAAALAQAQVLNSLNVVHAELLPQDKARIIKDFQKEAPTAMVGDGLNDAPALATADIGISMGISGSALATETGNIILMSNDIGKIPNAIRLAKRARRKVIQNVVLSILTKTAILGLAVAGYPLVWAAVLADVGTCLVVISNSMLLLRENEKPRTKCCESSTKRVRGCQSGTFGLGSCHDQKKSNTTGTNGCCAHKDRIKETKHSDDHCMGSNDGHSHCNSGRSIPSSCVKNHCTMFDGCHKICASGDGAKQFDQSIAKTGCHGTKHETLFRDNCSGSGHNRKSSNTAKTNGCCAHEDRINETKHLDDHCNSGPSMPSSCVKKHCTKFDGCHDICASDDGAKLFDQSVAKTGCHGSNHETLFRDNCSGSAHNRKSSNAAETNGCCAHEGRIKETKHSDDHCNSGPSMPSSCVKKHCTKFDGCHNICASDDGVKLFDQSVAKTGCHGSNHETLFRDNCSGSGHNLKSSNTARTNGCCAHENGIKDATHLYDRKMGSNDVGFVGSHETLLIDNCSLLKATGDGSSGRNDGGCEGITKTCVNLEEREIGGCCKSYKKECCGKSGYFGDSFRGGLSEIVIE
ncbi:cadmium zinc-transporting ATPase [Sarracenia purpurea var. burkii]